MNPLVKLSRRRNVSGSVSASTRPPSAAAMSKPASWCCTRSQFCAYTCSRFQLSGRLAAALIAPIRRNVSSVNSTDVGDELELRAGELADHRAQRDQLVGGCVHRDGTG